MPKKLVYNPISGTFDTISEVALAFPTGTPNPYGATLDANQNLSLEPADATNPGIVTIDAQTLAGEKTFNDKVTLSGSPISLEVDSTAIFDAAAVVSGNLFADGGVDVTATPGTDTLALGTANANIVNIGNPAATVNIYGTVNNVDVTNLNVTDALITLNNGGPSGSGSGSGFEVEEGGSPTGYVKVSPDRNSFRIKAPNTAGEASIVPGASGITLDQSSHDPLSLAAVGSTPNANGASLSGQQLTLQPADATNPGVVSTGTQSLAGNKTLTGNLNVDGTTRLATSLSGALIASTGTVSSLTLSDGQLVIGSTGNAPIAANLSAGSGISINNSPGNITISNSYVALGDIVETGGSILNNQAAPQTITGFAFVNATTRSFEAQVSIVINATTSLYESIKVHGIQKGSGWEISQSAVGDDSQVVLSIDSSGQMLYTTPSYPGFTSGTIRFRAETTRV